MGVDIKESKTKVVVFDKNRTVEAWQVSLNGDELKEAMIVRKRRVFRFANRGKSECGRKGKRQSVDICKKK